MIRRNSYYFIAIIAIILGICIGSAEAYNPPQIVLPLKDRAPIIIDGVIGADEWVGSASMTGFVTVGSRQWLSEQPRVWIIADKERLYVAWQYDHGSQQLTSEKTGRDSEVYRDDSMEIWIDTSGAGIASNIIQFIGNAKGAVYDVRAGNPSWNGDWQYRSRDVNGVWSAELAIKWDDLHMAAPQEGNKWGLNICMNRSRVFSSIAFARESFSEFASYAQMLFSDKLPIADVQRLGNLDLGSIDIGLRIYNPAEVSRKISVSLDLLPDAGGKSSLIDEVRELKPSMATSVEFKKVVKDSEKRDLAIKIADVKTNSVIYNAQFPVCADGATLQLTCSPMPSKGKVNVVVDLRRAPKFSGNRDLTLAIHPKDSSQPQLRKSAQVAANSITEFTFDEKSIPLGRNEITASLVSSVNDESVEKTISIYRPQRPAQWETSRPGIEPSLPKPWVPVTMHGDVMSLWGRQISFGQELLPIAMQSQQQNMLYAPITLAVSSGGKSVILKTPKYRVVQKDVEGIDIQAGPAKGRGIELSARTRTEFDGVMRIDLTLRPTHDKSNIDGLAIRIPMRAEVASQFVQSMKFEMLASGKSVFGRTNYFWVGNDDVGLCWFTEGFAGWNLKNPDRGIEIDRNHKGTFICIRMIDAPTVLDRPLTLTFGLLPTPFKPLPAGWQARDFQWNSPSTYYPYGFTDTDFSMDRYNQLWDFNVYFDPILIDSCIRIENDPAAAARSKAEEVRLAGLRSQGVNCIAWSQFTNVGRIQPPDYSYYGAEWATLPSGFSWQGAETQPIMPVCPNSGWADCLCKGVEKMADLGYNGQYFDTGAVAPCNNELHGCGYVNRDGIRERTTPFFASREIKKRIYKILYNKFGAKGEPFYISTLLNGDLQLPILTFDTAVVSGEEWNNRMPADMDYTKLLDLNEWRIKFWPAKWGFFHLPLDARIGESGSEMAFKSLTLFRLSSGTPVWAGYCDWRMYGKLFHTMKILGIDKGVEYHPWWSCGGRIAALNQKTLVSYYKNGNQLIISASNFSDKDVDECLALDMQKIGLENSIVDAAQDACNGENISANGKVLSFKLGAKDFRLIKLTTKRIHEDK